MRSRAPVVHRSSRPRQTFNESPDSSVHGLPLAERSNLNNQVLKCNLRKLYDIFGEIYTVHQARNALHECSYNLNDAIYKLCISTPTPSDSLPSSASQLVPQSRPDAHAKPTKPDILPRATMPVLDRRVLDLCAELRSRTTQFNDICAQLENVNAYSQKKEFLIQEFNMLLNEQRDLLQRISTRRVRWPVLMNSPFRR